MGTETKRQRRRSPWLRRVGAPLLLALGCLSPEAQAQPPRSDAPTAAPTGASEPAPTRAFETAPSPAPEPSAPARSAAAPGAPPAPVDAITAVLTSSRDPAGRPCTEHARFNSDGRTFVACGAAGVWEVSLDGQGRWVLVRTYDVGGEAVGLFGDADGVIWVKTVEVTARPLGTARIALPSSPPTQQGTPQAAPSPRAPAETPGAEAVPSSVPVGKVLAFDDGTATISIGERQRVRRGVRIEFSEDRTTKVGGDVLTESVVLAVGEVVAVAPNHSKVLVGVNERVPIGARAMPTGARKTASKVGPPRASGFWQLQGMLRPFVALEQFGGGVLVDAGFGYRFDGNLRLAAMFTPAGVGDVDSGDAIGVANAIALVSYDSQFLEMGAGVGAQTVNDVAFDLEPGSGLLVAQLARIGALDGLSLTSRSTIVLFHREFDLGSLDIHGQIPVGRDYWLVLGGGGGVAGHAYGEIGLRALVSGNGDATSTFITATAGGAGVFRSDGCQQTEFGFQCGGSRTYAGPMLGFGMEHRF